MSLQRVQELRRPAPLIRRWTADTPDTLERIYGSSPPEGDAKQHSPLHSGRSNTGDERDMALTIDDKATSFTSTSPSFSSPLSKRNMTALDDQAVPITSNLTTMSPESSADHSHPQSPQQQPHQRLPPPMLQRIPAREWRRWLDELPPLKVAQRKPRRTRTTTTTATATGDMIDKSKENVHGTTTTTTTATTTTTSVKRPAEPSQMTPEQSRRVRFSLPHVTIPASCYTPPISDSEYSSFAEDSMEPSNDGTTTTSSQMAPFYQTSVTSDVADQACANLGVNVSPLAMNEMVSELGQPRNGALELPRPSKLCQSELALPSPSDDSMGKETDINIDDSIDHNGSVEGASNENNTTEVTITGFCASREIMVAMLDRPAEMRELFTANPEYFALVQRVLLDAPVLDDFGVPGMNLHHLSSQNDAIIDSNAAYKQFISILFLGRNELPDRAWINVISGILQGAEPLIEKFKDMVGYDEDTWDDDEDDHYYADGDGDDMPTDDDDGDDDDGSLVDDTNDEYACPSEIIEVQRRFSESSINEDAEIINKLVTTITSTTSTTTIVHTDGSDTDEVDGNELLQSSMLSDSAITTRVASGEGNNNDENDNVSYCM